MFSKKTIAFLRELAKNNNKQWFDLNRQRYEDEVRTPALNYIESMAQPIHKISPHMIVSAKKVGGSMMRVHKDIRFSKDKTPYKTNVGIQFKHERGKDVHAPGFYLHIEPDSVFIGAGIWRPENSTLRNVRLLIDENQAQWKRLSKKLVNKDGFELHGDSLKRQPAGFSADHPLIEDLKRKDFIAVQNLRVSQIYGKDFTRDTAALFKRAAPLIRFICEADDLAF